MSKEEHKKAEELKNARKFRIQFNVDYYKKHKKYPDTEIVLVAYHQAMLERNKGKGKICKKKVLRALILMPICYIVIIFLMWLICFDCFFQKV